MNIFFLKTGHLITNLAPTLLHIPSLKYCPYNLTTYERKQNSKIPILGYLPKLKWDLGLAFGAHFRFDFPIKMFLI